MVICPRAAVRLLTVVAACLLLAACQLWPFNRDAQEATPPSGSQAEHPSEAAPQAAPIDRAMNLLQAGREDQAEELLSRIAEQRPDNATVRLLLAQIRQPPEELLGESYEEIVVRPGDSLSAIAARTIDNELLFYALARLNDIAVPRLLQPGQRLRVPTIDPPETAEEQPPEVADDTPDPSERNPEPLGTARRLISQERFNQAYALMLSAARAGKLDEPGDRLLAEAAVALAAEACREDDPERAMKLLNQASPWLSVEAEAGEFARQRRHVRARIALGEAELSLARGDHESAYESLMAARELGDDLRETHGERMHRLEGALGEYYHDGALSAWRDQKVDRSVELWDRVIRIDPDFEPARRYLERARRAQSELEALESGG